MQSDVTTGRANSWDEWSRLREVVVGRAESYSSHELDTSFRLFYFDNVQPELAGREGMRSIAIPDALLEELQEDLDGFVFALEGCGVVVHRPAPLEKQAPISSPYWTSTAIPALNVRDQTIVLGDTIVETAPHVRSRYFENDLLKPVFYRFFEAGTPWIAMPKPTLARGTLDPEYFDKQGIDLGDVMDDPEVGELSNLGYELIFDGAQCMRLGRDVLINVANKNHRMAVKWFNNHFGDKLRFHVLDAMADSHIDSIIVPLRPGLMMLRSPEFLKYLPDALKSWDVIYPPDTDDWRFPEYDSFGFNLSSRYIDINVLSIDENTVMVNSLCPDLIRELERHGLTTIPVQHRHRRLFSGGFHCFTLDVVRDGGCEDYLS